MSKLDTRQRSGGQRDQQSAAGGDFYNPNPAQDLYDREFNGITAGLSDTAEKGRRIINDNADVVRDKEARGTKTIAAQPTKSKTLIRPKSIMARAKLRGKIALLTVLVSLIGGAGVVSIFGAPAMSVVQLRQAAVQELNDQLKAFTDRHGYVMRAKFKKVDTNGSKMAERLATMSDKQAERYENKGVTIKRDARGSSIPERGKLTSMSVPHPDNNTSIVINSEADFANKAKNDPIVKAGLQKAENPWYASVTDKTFKMTLKLLGTSKTSRINGNTNEEREKSVNSVIGESKEIDSRTLTPEKNEKGEDTGRLIGPDGVPMTQDQIDEINRSNRALEGAGKIKPGNIASSVAKGVIITGTLDVACTAFNASRMVGALAKINVKEQSAQMAMASLLVPADKIMAGAANDGEVEFVGNKINNIGGPAPPEEVVDESKLYDPGTEKSAPMKQNDDMYATAFESPGIMAALHGDVPSLDSSQARFSLAGGFIGTLAKINEYIAIVVNGGDPNPKEVSEKCKYIQNPYVRGAALVAGIFVGGLSLGAFQAFGIASSLAISMAMPYMLSVAANIASGDMFKNLYGKDFGSGVFVGTASIMSTAANKRGMKPLSAQEAVAYTQSNKETLAQYGDTQKQIARSEPFNIYNQYSFLGSLATTITPTLKQSQSSFGMMAANVSSLIPTTLASLTGSKAKAASTIERFQQCEDPGYKAIGIGADIYCNIRYGLSEKELSMDPIENAKWMTQTGNIAKDDDTGAPIDNGQKWNYKKFLDECANRTVGYGENQEENQGDGSNCLSAENESLNQHFRVFTMDLSVADYTDGIDEVGSVQTGEQGPVSSDGWAYPTTKDAKITSGYKAPDRGDDHRGVDLAQAGGAMGKPIFAAYDGKVVVSGPASGFGNWIVIEHTVEGKKMSSVYGHMRASDLLVKTGDTVKAGQLISRIGNEGQSTGAHLHFEIWNGNRLECGGDCSINPTPIIEKAKGTPARENNEVRV